MLTPPTAPLVSFMPFGVRAAPLFINCQYALDSPDDDLHADEEIQPHRLPRQPRANFSMPSL
uniref:Uncharacterized protein n=1 Tax=Cucumis melo TaxID=3656 RepID=A0A9I9DGL2_CUCME